MSAGMKKEATQDTVFTWFEDAHVAGRAACVSGGTTTTVDVDDGWFYTPTTILQVEETGEHMLVSATAGNSLTVVRGLAGTEIVSITSAHHQQTLGTALDGNNVVEGKGVHGRLCLEVHNIITKKKQK